MVPKGDVLERLEAFKQRGAEAWQLALVAHRRQLEEANSAVKQLAEACAKLQVQRRKAESALHEGFPSGGMLVSELALASSYLEALRKQQLLLEARQRAALARLKQGQQELKRLEHEAGKAWAQAQGVLRHRQGAQRVELRRAEARAEAEQDEAYLGALHRRARAR
jgi:hypothetical protein